MQSADILPTLPAEIIIEIARCHHLAFDGLRLANKALYAKLQRRDKQKLFCDCRTIMVGIDNSVGEIDYVLKPNQCEQYTRIISYNIMHAAKIIHIHLNGSFFMSRSYTSDNQVGIWTCKNVQTRYYPAANTFEEEVRRLIENA